MFGKLYKRAFLEHYNIRMNMSHSNEDTGFNCVVKGCSNKIWYIPKPVYTWRYKPDSITRFNNGMYGSESGMCGYLTNMVWQIKELEKRFVNKNYILSETISIMCTLYHFYIENMQRYPLGTEANMEWCRYYYEQCYKPYEHLIDEAVLNNTFANVAAGQNVAGKGIIPKITFFDWMKELKSKPYSHDKMHDVGGSVIEIPQTTPEDYPVEVTEYMNNIIPVPKINTNTNLARMDGMQRILEEDKKQRAEFLEKNIIPKVNKIDEEKITDVKLRDASIVSTHSTPEVLKIQKSNEPSITNDNSKVAEISEPKKKDDDLELTGSEKELIKKLRDAQLTSPPDAIPCTGSEFTHYVTDSITKAVSDAIASKEITSTPENLT